MIFQLVFQFEQYRPALLNLRAIYDLVRDLNNEIVKRNLGEATTTNSDIYRLKVKNLVQAAYNNLRAHHQRSKSKTSLLGVALAQKQFFLATSDKNAEDLLRHEREIQMLKKQLLEYKNHLQLLEQFTQQQPVASDAKTTNSKNYIARAKL